jgi:hypothetical protein
MSSTVFSPLPPSATSTISSRRDGGAERVFHLLDTPPESATSPIHVLPPIKGRVEFAI